jgi:hypothetical protein
MSKPVNRVLDKVRRFFESIFSGGEKGPKVVYRNPNRKRSEAHGKSDSGPQNPSAYQEKLDAILDKIKESGYDSLTKEEKEFLFNASKE